MRDRGTTSGMGRAMTLIALGRGPDEAGHPDCDLPPDPRSVCAARSHVRLCLTDVVPGDALADLELIVSELVTNAVRVSDVDQQHIGLRLKEVGGRILVEVLDGCPSPPRRPQLNTSSLSGRGLALVAELAEDVGWYPMPSGKAVWALYELPSSVF